MQLRLQSIDTLRFIAAYSVCLAHFIPTFNFNFIISDFVLGKLGVVIFFMISGYLIPTSIKYEKNSLKKFWTSRFFRLYPMYWMSILLAVLLSDFSYTTILANLTMFQSLIGSKDIIGVYWTLNIEMFFYIFCTMALVLKLLHNRTFAIISTLLFIIISIGFSLIRFFTEKNIPIAIPMLMSVMLLGYNLKLHETNIINTRQLYTINFLFFLALPFISYYGYQVKYNLSGDSIQYLYSYMIGIILFYFIYIFNIFNKYVSILGTYTYSTYLLHSIVLIILSKCNLQLDPLIKLLIYFFSIVFFSYIGYKFIEEPFQKIGRLINKYYLARKA